MKGAMDCTWGDSDIVVYASCVDQPEWERHPLILGCSFYYCSPYGYGMSTRVCVYEYLLLL